MKEIDLIALILVIIGGVNWALFGIVDTNLVALLLAESVLAKVVYGLVGLGAVWLLFSIGRLIGGGDGG